MLQDASDNLTPSEKCLALIAAGASALYNGNLGAAEGSFQVSLLLAKQAPSDQQRDLTALALSHLSVVRKRHGRGDEAQKLREQANARLEDNTPFMPVALFHHLMASALMELTEYRQAIPFWEQSLILKEDYASPTAMADALRRVGECYSRVGLKDHAAIPLRSAVKLFRNNPGDPRLSAALLTLGNALRKSQPVEAEACYREVADLHAAKGQLLSATPAWVNLGVLCSEQSRHAESLEHHKKVLEIREKSPGVRRDQIAIVYNNIANCYRRMSKFSEAHESVDRAIELLKDEGGSGLGSAYGTKGLVYKDEGSDSEAVEWLQRAYAQHQKVASPKLDSIVEDLENEIAALKRLGKTEGAALAEGRLQAVRESMNAIPTLRHDLSSLEGSTTRCALLLELNFQSWVDSAQRKRECADLANRLTAEIEEKGLGFLGGSVTIPESTTLIFYGSDAEELFRAVQPILSGESLCSGARVTIRQQDGCREVTLPTRPN
jgi:tetratricopeptide (TPR) repeat protein